MDYTNSNGMENSEMEQQEYNDRLAQVASLAVAYVNTDRGYFQMRDAFNELCEMSGANKGIDLENTIGRRKLLVQSVCIKTIPSLSRAANDWLEDQLKDIAEDYTTSRTRGCRR